MNKMDKYCKKNCFGVFLLPGLSGFMIFYLLPFILSFYQTVISGKAGNRRFAGFENYKQLLTHPIFLQALKNSVLFMSIAVPINMMLALIIALGIRKIKCFKKAWQCVFLIPLVIPTASVAYFFKMFFAKSGPASSLAERFGGVQTDWFQTSWALGIIILIFVWKTLGYNIILFTAGLYSIPETYYESAAIDGSGAFAAFRNITWPYLMPTTFLVFIMSIINSFKVFKENYLIAGAYPHESIYMLQHYMNNMFLAVNYQKLTTSAYIFVVFILFLLAALFKGQRKFTSTLEQ